MKNKHTTHNEKANKHTTHNEKGKSVEKDLYLTQMIASIESNNKHFYNYIFYIFKMLEERWNKLYGDKEYILKTLK